jgi:hypothetical protein
VTSASITLLLVGGALAVSLVIAPFTRTFRDGSAWLRSSLFFAGVLMCMWAVLSLFTELRATSLPRVLIGLRGDIGGVGVGILLAVGTNPEFRRRAARHQTSNQSLEPTPGRRDKQI